MITVLVRVAERPVTLLPIIVFLLPVVIPLPVFPPKRVLFSPVLMSSPAPLPTAVLPEAVALDSA